MKYFIFVLLIVALASCQESYEIQTTTTDTVQTYEDLTEKALKKKTEQLTEDSSVCSATIYRVVRSGRRVQKVYQKN